MPEEQVTENYLHVEGTPEPEVEEIKTESNQVDEIIDLFKSLGRFKSLEDRRKDRLEKMRKEYETLPENSYKKAQLENKMLLLEKKINRNWVWNSAEGTYKLTPNQRAEKLNRSTKRKKHNG